MTKKEIVKILKNFTLDYDVNYKEIEVIKLQGGHLHESYKISHIDGKYKYVIQKLNPIFDLNAINNNLFLLDKACGLVKNKISNEWQFVKYFNAKSNGKKNIFR